MSMLKVRKSKDMRARTENERVILLTQDLMDSRKRKYTRQAVLNTVSSILSGRDISSAVNQLHKPFPLMCRLYICSGIAANKVGTDEILL